LGRRCCQIQHNETQHSNKNVRLVIVTLNVKCCVLIHYAECRNAYYHCAECRSNRNKAKWMTHIYFKKTKRFQIMYLGLQLERLAKFLNFTWTNKPFFTFWKVQSLLVDKRTREKYCLWLWLYLKGRLEDVFEFDTQH